MIEQVSTYLTVMILSIMLFFSFIIAPVVFTTLDEDNARKFIRKLFPFYYNVNLGLSFIVLLIFVFLSKLGIEFYLILANSHRLYELIVLLQVVQSTVR